MRYALLCLVIVAPLRAEIPFTTRPGFVVEKVAGPPLVEHPMFACFDDRGRLYVADSGGKNLKAEDLLKQLPSCIRILEDTDGDGVFDKSTVFADKMSFPMGVLWHRGHVYVCSPPSLWRLTDTNGDGVADERKELVTKFGFTGNAADIHGPWLGPDGWLYWTDGRHGHEIKTPTGTMKGKAARIFRCKLDGSNVEVVCGGGMDDPVQMAFTEEGEPFAVVDIFQARPTRVDALIYCIDGGVFPYYEAVLGEFKRTGPLLPAVSELGWVAPSGLIRYRGDHLGKEFTDTMLSTQFNTHKIIRHTLQRVGAGFTSKDDEFITSTNPDFHPTSLVEDADGSLLVIDTGGWFRIGCPTSQVAKPEIKGGLYRVRRKDVAKIDDPRGLKIGIRKKATDELAALIDDPRWAVRDAVINELTQRETEACTPLGQILTGDGTSRAKVNAIWALTQINTERSRWWVRKAMADSSVSVRQCAARSIGINRDLEGRYHMEEFLADRTAPVRREAAMALGRMRSVGSVLKLNFSITGNEDRFLEHAIIHAMIEIGDSEAIREWGISSPSRKSYKAAFIALSQIAPEVVKTHMGRSLLSQDRGLQQAAWQVLLKRPEWFSEFTKVIEFSVNKDLSEERHEAVRDSIITAAQLPIVETFVATTLKDEKTSTSGKTLLLEVVAAFGSPKCPPSWVDAVQSSLSHKEPVVVRQAIRAVRACGLTQCDAALDAVVHSTKIPLSIRLEALATVAPRRNVNSREEFDLILSCWKGDAATDQRSFAAETVGVAKFNEEQLLVVAGIVPRSSALELPRLLDAFRTCTSAKVGRELVANLAKTPALASVTPADLRAALASFPAEIRTAAEPLFKKFSVDEAAQRKKLAELSGVWSGGDVNRGRHVFFSKKSLCAACHAVKGEGERIGPDLSKIGAIRTETDLLEAIVFPSNSIARGFESVTAYAKAGRSHSGLIRRESAEALYLITPERTELRLPRREIESLEPSRTSVMPQGLEVPLSRQELGDLIAYLRSLK